MKSEELKGKRLAVFGANNVVDEVICLPMHHALSEDDVQKVIDTIKEK